MKIPKRDRDLLDELVEAAGYTYWMDDQGIGSGVSRARADFAAVYKRMERRLARPVVRRTKKEITHTPITQ